MCTDLCVAERITEYDKANAEYDKMNMIKYKHLGKVRKEYQEFFYYSFNFSRNLKLCQYKNIKYLKMHSG